MSYTDYKKVSSELGGSEITYTSSPNITTVNEWIEQAEDYINGLASKTYSESSYTDTFHYNGEKYLFLKNTPLLSVSKVEYNSKGLGSAPSWTELTLNTYYVVDYDRGVIILNYKGSSGFNKFRVTYTAGYSTIPKTVEMLATKLVANRVLSTLLSKDVNERNSGGSISVGDISIVEPANYGVGNYKQLQEDIKSLEKELVSGFKVYRYG